MPGVPPSPLSPPPSRPEVLRPPEPELSPEPEPPGGRLEVVYLIVKQGLRLEAWRAALGGGGFPSTL